MLRLAQSNKRLCLPGASAKPGRRHAAAGFTLVELLLVVALVVALAGAAVFNFTSLLKGNQLEEGTTRLETLMRFARAQAANSGRKVQLVFAESTNTPAATTGEVRATWEPDPLRQPGRFAELSEAQWHVQQINEMVQVESVKLLDSNSGCPMTATCPEAGDQDDEGPAARSFSPITFYPDGSCDSAEIVVAARSTEEEPRMAVRLVGLTGSISHQLVASDEDETITDVNVLERPSLLRNPSRPAPGAPESPGAIPSPSPVTSSSRNLPTTPRGPVGETNSVDRIE